MFSANGLARKQRLVAEKWTRPRTLQFSCPHTPLPHTPHPTPHTPHPHSPLPRAPAPPLPHPDPVPPANRPLRKKDALRVRIAWGGGAERLWEGTIAVSQGAISEPRPLGIEADEPGSMSTTASISSSSSGAPCLRRRRYPRDGPAECEAARATCRCRRRPPRSANRSPAHRPLQRAAQSTARRPREPPPGPPLAGRPLPRPPGAQVARLRPARDATCRNRAPPAAAPRRHQDAHQSPARRCRHAARVWSTYHDGRAGQPAKPSVEIRLPADEGVYNLVLSAQQGSTWPHPIRPGR